MATAALDAGSAAAEFDVEAQAVDRLCELQRYDPRPVPPVSVRADIIAYASPDSTFAVTKKLFDAAKKSILIGIYDFTAAHMRQLVLDAMARGVKVSLMLDIDSADERRVFDDLVQMGVTGVPAPSCANDTVHVFASSHEKVIVIDDEWCLVQSGNYSNNSIPLNVSDGEDGQGFRTGNRDTGLAVRSRPLATFLRDVLTSDMARVIDAATPEMVISLGPEEDLFLVERAPTRRPSRLFASRSFNPASPLRIQPVLTPDNYLDVIPPVLAAATKSIVIEQQYIRAIQPQVRTLLDAIAAARAAHPRLQVRIVLGKVFDKKDLPKERKNLKTLNDEYGLSLDTNIRYVNTDRLVHCHNKMIIVDDAAVLISSQNWSDFAITRNREAGLWVPDAEIAQYFRAIFDVDFKDAFRTPEEGVSGAAVLEAQDLADGGFIRVERADYQEV